MSHNTRGSPEGPGRVDAARQESYRDFREYTEEKAESLGQDELAHEEAWMVDHEGKGEEVGSALSDHSMKFSELERERLQGQALIHNHPIPVSFSSADVKFAFQNRLDEVAVSTSEGLHIMKINNGEISENLLRYLPGTMYDMHRDVTKWHVAQYQNDLMMDVISKATGKERYYKDSKKVMELLDGHEVYGKYLEYEFIPWN